MTEQPITNPAHSLTAPTFTKKELKAKRAIEQHWATHPLDDPHAWLGEKFERAPWSDEKIKEFQKRIDSAFGAENALILAWSGDQRYWDGFYTDWHATGLPKEGSFEKKPILLYGSIPLSPQDYVYVVAPRWLILEREDISQHATSWEASAWVSDKDMIGGRKRIRTEQPPKNFYTILRKIAAHDQPALIGDEPPCCVRVWQDAQRPCYGRYREPSDIDIAFIGGIRRRMDADGVAQRNDTHRDVKMLRRAEAQTRLYEQQAERQQASAIKSRIMDDPMGWLGHILEAKGSTMSVVEAEKLILEGINQSQNERLQETI